MNWLPFNLALIKNPYNWLVVGLMVAILGLSLHLIFGQGSPVGGDDTANPN